MGGAQAIGALAFGTESVRAGGRDRRPGQRLRAGGQAPGRGHRGHRRLRGPSELVVVATRRRGRRAGGPRPAGPGRARRGPAAGVVARPRAAGRGRGPAVERLAPEPPERGGRRRSQLVHVADARAAVRAGRRDRPRAPGAGGRRGRGAGRPRCARRAACSWAATPATAFGDYVAARTTCCPPAAPRASSRALSPATFRRRMARVSLPDEAPPPASRPPAPRWPAPRASPYTPSRWSAAHEPQRRHPPHHQRDRHQLRLDLDGAGAGTRSTGVGLLRPPAGRAGAPRRSRPGRAGARATSRPAPTTPWRTPGSPSGGRWTRRWATARASRATAPPCRWTRRAPACAIDVSGRPFTVFEGAFPRGGGGRLRHRPGRGVRPRGGQHRQAHAAPAGGGAAPTRTTWSRRRSRRSPARCARRWPIDPTRPACPPPRGSCERPRRDPRLRDGQPALGREGARARGGAAPSSPATTTRVRAADGVVLPGVGALPRAMEHVRAARASTSCCASGVEAGVPVLGICMGMQLLFECTTELGGAEGIGPARRARWSRSTPAA